jgi:hypothetical protein
MLRSQFWGNTFHSFTNDQQLKHDRRLRFVVVEKRSFVQITFYIAGLSEQP